MISWPFLTKLTKQIQNSSIFRRTRREDEGPSKRGHSSSFTQNHGRSPKKNSSLLPDIMVSHGLRGFFVTNFGKHRFLKQLGRQNHNDKPVESKPDP